MTARDRLDPDQESPQLDGLAAAVLGAAEVALFENLYLAHSREAQHIAVAFLGDQALAEDAVHTAYLRVLRLLVSGTRWPDPGAARAAVLRNVRWAALQALRTRHRHRESELARAQGQDDLVEWARAEARALCEHVVAHLKPVHRTVLHHRYVEGLTSAEAAHRLGISVEACDVRLHRALRAARRAAHALGVRPGLAGALIGPVLDKVRRQRHRRRKMLRLPLRLEVAGIAGITAVAALTAPAMARQVGGQHSTARQASPPIASMAAHSRRSAPPIDEAAVVDGVAAVVGDRVVVVALGQGSRCRCWEVFQTADDGVTWQGAVAALPAGTALARIDVPATYPSDPRIFVRDAGGHLLVSAEFGTSFRASATPPPALAPVHGVPCRLTSHRVNCGGATPPLPVAGDGAGSALTTRDGRFLYFRRDRGVLCSRDGGATWSTRCPSGG